MKLLRYCLLLLTFMISHNAFALKCGRYVINTGMYKNEVYKKCGEPDSIETHLEIIETGNTIKNRQNYPDSSFSYGQNNTAQLEIVVEEWIYNFGSLRFQQYLRFENGKLQEIRDLNRGYR